MSKKVGIIIAIVAVAVLCLSAVNLFMSLNPSQPEMQKNAQQETQEEKQDIQYVLYLGTNDKDTNKPVFDPDESKAKAEESLIKHFGGYTIQEVNGGWEDNGKR